MMHDILVVTLGVLLAGAIKTLLMATLWNTHVWAQSRANRCMKCGEENPSLTVQVQGERKSICEKCCRQDFDMTFEEAVRRGIVKARKPG